MKLLVDNNLPPCLGRGLNALFNSDHDVIHIRDKFGTGSLSDEAWIRELAEEGGWCVLSSDRRIATRKPSRDLFLRSNLIGFFLLPAVAKLPLHALTARILILWPIVERTAHTKDRGCFEIGIKGTSLRAVA